MSEIPNGDTTQHADGPSTDRSALERDNERRRQRDLPPLESEVPATWVIDPTGDAPEPSEPG